MDDMLLLFLGMLVLAVIVASFFTIPSSRLFPREDAARERVRREVHQEFEVLIQESTGVRRWWLVLRREREICRRVAQVIYENRV
jgi:hypothetical protein